MAGKYATPKHPLLLERTLDVMTMQDHIRDEYIDDHLSRRLQTPDAASRTAVRQLQEQENFKRFTDSLDSQWREGYRQWLFGKSHLNKDKSLTPWGETPVHRFNPGARKFLEDELDMRFEFRRGLLHLEMLGAGTTLNQSYLYYKFIVQAKRYHRRHYRDSNPAPPWYDHKGMLEFLDYYKDIEPKLPPTDGRVSSNAPPVAPPSNTIDQPTLQQALSQMAPGNADETEEDQMDQDINQQKRADKDADDAVQTTNASPTQPAPTTTTSTTSTNRGARRSRPVTNPTPPFNVVVATANQLARSTTQKSVLPSNVPLSSYGTLGQPTATTQALAKVAIRNDSRTTPRTKITANSVRAAVIDASVHENEVNLLQNRLSTLQKKYDKTHEWIDTIRDYDFTSADKVKAHLGTIAEMEKTIDQLTKWNQQYQSNEAILMDRVKQLNTESEQIQTEHNAYVEQVTAKLKAARRKPVTSTSSAEVAELEQQLTKASEDITLYDSALKKKQQEITDMSAANQGHFDEMVRKSEQLELLYNQTNNINTTLSATIKEYGSKTATLQQEINQKDELIATLQQQIEAVAQQGLQAQQQASLLLEQGNDLVGRVKIMDEMGVVLQNTTTQQTQQIESLSQQLEAATVARQQAIDERNSLKLQADTTVATLEGQLQQLTVENTSIKTANAVKIAQLESERNVLQQQFQSAQAQLQILNSSSSVTATTMKKLSDETERALALYKQSEESLQQATASNAALSGRVAFLEDEGQGLLNQHAKLDASYEKLKEATKKIEEEKTAMAKQLKVQVGQLTQLTQQLEAANESGNQTQALMQQIQELQEAMKQSAKQHKKVIAEESNKQTQLQSSIAETKDQLTKATSANRLLKAKNKELTNNASRLTDEAVAAGAEINRLTTQTNAQQTEINRYKTLVKEEKKASAVLNEKLTTQEKELVRRQTLLQQANATYEQNKQAYESLEAEYNQVIKSNTASQSTITQLQEQLSTLQQTMNESQTDRRETEQRYEQSLTEANTLAGQLEAQNAKTAETNRRYRSKQVKLQADLAAVKLHSTKLQEEIEDLKKINKTRKETIEQMTEAAELAQSRGKEISDLEEQLKNSESSREEREKYLNQIQQRAAQLTELAERNRTELQVLQEQSVQETQKFTQQIATLQASLSSYNADATQQNIISRLTEELEKATQALQTTRSDYQSTLAYSRTIQEQNTVALASQAEDSETIRLLRSQLEHEKARSFAYTQAQQNRIDQGWNKEGFDDGDLADDDDDDESPEEPTLSQGDVDVFINTVSPLNYTPSRNVQSTFISSVLSANNTFNLYVKGAPSSDPIFKVYQDFVNIREFRYPNNNRRTFTATSEWSSATPNEAVTSYALSLQNEFDAMTTQYSDRQKTAVILGLGTNEEAAFSINTLNADTLEPYITEYMKKLKANNDATDAYAAVKDQLGDLVAYENGQRVLNKNSRYFPNKSAEEKLQIYNDLTAEADRLYQTMMTLSTATDSRNLYISPNPNVTDITQEFIKEQPLQALHDASAAYALLNEKLTETSTDDDVVTAVSQILAEHPVIGYEEDSNGDEQPQMGIDPLLLRALYASLYFKLGMNQRTTNTINLIHDRLLRRIGPDNMLLLYRRGVNARSRNIGINASDIEAASYTSQSASSMVSAGTGYFTVSFEDVYREAGLVGAE